MKKLFFIPIFLFFSSILLCSCSVQKNCDAYEFCERLNEQLGSELVIPSSYYKVQNKNEYNYMATLTGGRNVLITINADEALTVLSAEVTVIKNASELTVQEKSEIFNFYKSLCSVLFSLNDKESEEILFTSEINTDAIAFFAKEITVSENKRSILFITNEEIISFSAQRE